MNTKSTLPFDMHHSKTFKLLDNLIRNACYSCTQAKLREQLYEIATDCCLHSVKPEMNCRPANLQVYVVCEAGAVFFRAKKEISRKRVPIGRTVKNMIDLFHNGG